MCGIYFMYRNKLQYTPTNHKTLHNRGPDEVKIVSDVDYYAAFYRLAIMDVAGGMQPFVKKDANTDIIMLCNGEIYNYQELAVKYNLYMHSKSDAECILELYQKVGIDRCIRELNGEFAVIIYDKIKNVVHFARDRFGRKPLYMACNTINGVPSLTTFEIGSLYKSLDLSNKTIVYPGTICTVDLSNGKQILTVQEYNRFMFNPSSVTLSLQQEYDMLYNIFVKAVKKRITQTERQVGFLLSGGFDSSLVLSVALSMDIIHKPHVFTIGFDENASDIKAAEEMVTFLRKKHGADCIIWHKVILPVDDGLEAIPSVIYAIETYDTTTIRASVPMWLISKYISEKTDVKVIISGEGSDELFGGYMYFKYAPNDQAVYSEICTLLNDLHYYDVLRADKTTSYFGLEVRTPFLDDEFVKAVLATDKIKATTTTTKLFIREIVEDLDLLPYNILYGKKEAFSDAVGHNWKDSINDHAEKMVNVVDYIDRAVTADYAVHCLPTTYETVWYQNIFNDYFPGAWYLLPQLWLPNQTWVNTGTEPSARALSKY